MNEQQNTIMPIEESNYKEIISEEGQRFLDSILQESFTDKKTVDCKKILATAAIIAKEKKVEMPQGLAESMESPVSLATNIDNGIDLMKVSYQVDNGIKSIQEGLVILGNKAIARVAEGVKNSIDLVTDYVHKNVDNWVEVGIEKGVDVVSNLLTPYFPQAQLVAPIVKTFLRNNKEKVKNGIKKGMSLLSSAAKTVVNGGQKAVSHALKKCVNLLGFA